MSQYFNFVSNSFVVKTPYSEITIGETQYIIPFYAVQDIIEDGNSIEVKLKKSLSKFDSFDKVIYKINESESFFISFNDKFEKQCFLENIKKFKSQYQNNKQ